MPNLDLDQLSSFVHREVSLLQATLRAQNWSDDTVDEWCSHGYEHVFAFCAEDQGDALLRQTAVSDQRRQLIARLQCFDNFTARTAPAEAKDELEQLRSDVSIKKFLNNCQLTHQRFIKQNARALQKITRAGPASRPGF